MKISTNDRTSTKNGENRVKCIESHNFNTTVLSTKLNYNEDNFLKNRKLELTAIWKVLATCSPAGANAAVRVTHI